MAPEKSADFLIREQLNTFNISSLTEWDVLVFLYRHGTSLTSAAEISHLLGNEKAMVSGALERLETLGLIQRSRGSQGLRLYRISVPQDPSRCSWFMELIRLTEKREGRLLLLKNLPRGRTSGFGRGRGLHIA